jgi:transcriptional regulator with XRE-family HTH domain
MRMQPDKADSLGLADASEVMAAPVEQTLPQRIQDSRLARNLGRSDLARLIGVSPQAVSAMESEGGGVASTNLFPLADALGVSARWLVTGIRDDEVERGATFSPTVARIATHLACLPDEKLNALALILGIKL